MSMFAEVTESGVTADPLGFLTNDVMEPTQAPSRSCPAGAKSPRRARALAGLRRVAAHAVLPTAWLAVLLAVPTACDGGGDGEPAPPTFGEVHERVFQVSCVFSTCHKGGPSPAGDMSLEREEAHAALVEVSSSMATGKVRVVPGDPDASYLLEKLTAPMPAAGETMPPDAPLEAERIDLVRQWIEAGAADD